LGFNHPQWRRPVLVRPCQQVGELAARGFLEPGELVKGATAPSSAMSGTWRGPTASSSLGGGQRSRLWLLVVDEFGRRLVVAGGSFAEESADNRLGVILDLAQMVGTAKAFRVDLVQRFGA